MAKGEEKASYFFKPATWKLHRTSLVFVCLSLWCMPKRNHIKEKINSVVVYCFGPEVSQKVIMVGEYEKVSYLMAWRKEGEREERESKTERQREEGDIEKQRKGEGSRGGKDGEKGKERERKEEGGGRWDRGREPDRKGDGDKKG